MKVLLVVSSFPNLSETFIIQEIRELNKRKIDVYLVTNRFNEDKYSLDIESHIKKSKIIVLQNSPLEKVKIFLVQCVKSPKNLIAPILSMRKKSSRINLFEELLLSELPKFETIICHFAINGNKAVSWKDTGLIAGKIITHFHGSGLTSNNPQKGVYPRLQEVGDAFIVNSSYTRSKAVNKGYPKERIVLIPALFDQEKFEKNKKVEYFGDKLRILSVGRLIKLKGWKYGILAIKKLIEAGYTNVEYKIVGDGPDYNELEFLIATNNLGNYIKLLGPKSPDDVCEEMTNSDIFLMPGIIDDDGRCEAQGLVVLEAQAVGLPIIASRIGGLPDSMKDGFSGFLCSEKSIEEIVNEILKFYFDSTLLVQFSKNAKDYVNEKFYVPKLMENLLFVYGLEGYHLDVKT